MNTHSLGQFVTLGNQSGSTGRRPAAPFYPTPLTRVPRVAARGPSPGRSVIAHGTGPFDGPMNVAILRAAAVVPGASRRGSTPTSGLVEGARSDGSASTSFSVIRPDRN